MFEKFRGNVKFNPISQPAIIFMDFGSKCGTNSN